MNREIQFRAWHIELEDMTFSIEDNSKFWSKADEYPSMYHVMQLTGLKDKNGKEIYEGDILVSKGLGELSGSKPNNIGHVPKDIPHKVFFHEGAFKFRHNKRSINHCLSGLTIRYFSLEVIGNIYEQKNSIANIDNQL